MKKINKILITIISGVFVLLFSWIIINAIFFGNDVIFNYNPIFLTIFTAVDIIALVLIYKNIIPKIVKYKYLPGILFLLFGVIAIVVSYNLRLNPTWDMGRVFNMAKSYIETGSVNDVYLYEFQNNIAITYIFIFVFKIFSIFNITDYIAGITIFNALIVTTTVICLYYTVKKMYGKEKALMTLIICIFTTPLYLHAAIYYTDTMSMLFCILALLLYVFIRDENNKRRNTVLQILFGIILGMSFQVKVTAVFIVIAILVEEFLNMKFKNIINNFKIAIPVAIITVTIFNVFSNNVAIKDKQLLDWCKMPVGYWFLIGSVENGGFNQELYEYVKGYETYEERKNAAIEKFIEIMKQYTVSTFISHVNEKLKYTWADGTYLAPEKLRRDPVDRGTLYEYTAVGGEKTDYYKYFPQIMHMSMLVLMVVVVINILRKRNYESDDVFLFISIFGIAVFLIMWENRSRYILTLLPIMLILKVRGIEILSNIGKNKILKLKEGNIQECEGVEENGKEKSITSSTNVL